MPKLGLVPLFDKLIDEDTEVPFEKNPKMFASIEELQASIKEDLVRLLNTRLTIFWKDFAQKRMFLPFEYGVDISASLSTENVQDMQELEERIENAIKTFEPRLVDPKVTVQGIGNDPSSLFINIEAYTIVENRRIPLSFPVILKA